LLQQQVAGNQGQAIAPSMANLLQMMQARQPETALVAPKNVNNAQVSGTAKRKTAPNAANQAQLQEELEIAHAAKRHKDAKEKGQSQMELHIKAGIKKNLWRRGMHTLTKSVTARKRTVRSVRSMRAKNVEFFADTLVITLQDGQTMRIPLDGTAWLRWLAEATPEQRAKWSLEPGGFAIYWEELDDGIEIEHLRRLPITQIVDNKAVKHLEGV